MQTVDGLQTAFAVAFARPWSYVIAAVGAVAMFLLLIWSGQLLTHYPSGWTFQASPLDLSGLVLIAVLFGLLLPLQVSAVAKAHSAATAAGGLASGIAGLLSTSCCAPVLIPSLLSFAGFSGTTVLTFNGTVHQFTTPLMLLSILLLAMSIVLVIRTLSAACPLPARRAPSGVQRLARGKP